MKTSDLTSVAALAVLGVIGLIAWRAYQGGVSGLGRDIGSTFVKAADGTVQGVVEAVGGALGIPVTDAAACRQAIGEGDTWTASLMCPAKDFFAASWATIKTNATGLPDLGTTPDGGRYDAMGNRIN